MSVGVQDRVRRRAYAHAELPARYHRRWRDEFEDRVRSRLRPGIQILDLGSGANPALPVDQRPRDCFYLGVDISQAQLERAPSGSYDEWRVADATEFVDELGDRFDLIVSWQVLEHIRPLERAIENCQTYLRSGGSFIALFSGSLSVFGVVNRLIPQRLGVASMKHLLGRDPDSVFPAYYDGTRYSALRRTFKSWESVEIVPQFRGATYFSFNRAVQLVYLRYEDWAARTRRVNLATHYLVEASR